MDKFPLMQGCFSVGELITEQEALYTWFEPTKPSMDRGSERKVPHIGTETRSKLLREAAVRNIGQWTRV